MTKLQQTLTQQLDNIEVAANGRQDVNLVADALLRPRGLLDVHSLERHEHALGVLGEVDLGVESLTQLLDDAGGAQ